MNTDPLYEDCEDPALDALLARARWPEPSADSSRQLLSQWAKLSRHSWLGRGSWVRSVLATATGIALLATLAWAAWNRAHTPRRRIVHNAMPTPSPAAQIAKAGPMHEPVQPVLLVRPIASRAPTALELVLCHLRESPSPAPEAVGVVQTADARLDAVLRQISGSSDAIAVEQAATSLRSHMPAEKLETRLAQIALTSGDDRRVAAMRLLACTASTRCIELFVTLARDPAVRITAVEGLCRVADAAQLAACVRRESSSPLRRQLLAALLHRPPAQAAPLYLQLLEDPELASPALGALHDVPPPFVDAIFQRLGDRRVEMRLAAARALGKIDGVSTTARLIAMVRDGSERREALMALSASDGAEAKAFISLAARVDPLSGTVRSILLQQHDLH